MVKLGLITLHRVKNYGSVLQAYATQEILKKNNYEAELIDYYPKRYTKLGMLRKVKNQNKYLKNSFILRLIARIIIFPSYCLRFKNFNKFVKKHLNLSKQQYRNYDELKEQLPYNDIYVTGSDQVWNSSWNDGIDECLFLNFPNIKKKIAYAASFGKSHLDDNEKQITKELLSKYNYISLREMSGVNICEDLGIKNTVNVLDPTLLLTANEWREVSSNKFKNEKYILVYNLNRNKKIDNYAENLSKKNGLKVKYLSYQLHELYRNGKMYCNPKVEDFLALIDNAEFVISDSFHATAFSLIFNKQFVIVYPDKFSTRLQSILNLLDLDNRVAKNENDLKIVDKNIDYELVNEKLDIERQKSMEWLLNNLKKMEEDNLFPSKEKCSGCGACMNICPKHAISLVEDEYGFLYPRIDNGKCINCGLCKKVCAYQNDKLEGSPIKVYAAIRNKEDDILKKSASGGIFSSIAINFINNGGIIYGSSMEKENGKLTVKHIRVDNIDDLKKLQGSKYVKSLMGTIYDNIKNDLKNQKKVLFSGTPCQVAALKKYLDISKVDSTNLYTIDIICHGTPSTKMFQDYIKFYEDNVNGEIESFKFRDKKYKGHLRGTITYIKKKDNKKVEKPLYGRLDSYYKMFLFGDSYRENCYSCKYANEHRVGDITIGDYWGCKEEHPNWFNESNDKFDAPTIGISCILLNNAKGMEILKKYGQNIYIKETNFEKVAKHNAQLRNPSSKPKNRNKIFDIYKNSGYKALDKYIKKKQGIKRLLYVIYYKIK